MARSEKFFRKTHLSGRDRTKQDLNKEPLGWEVSERSLTMAIV